MTTITRRRAKAAIAAVWLGLPVFAADLALPQGARLTAETSADAASYLLPLERWQPDIGIPSLRVEGAKTRQAWRIDGQSATTLQLIAPLRDQLVAAGYEVMFECMSDNCGGFDFRFETEVLPGPDMYVNLSDYRFVSAVLPGAASDAISLLVSRNNAAGYVQIIRISNDAAPPVSVTASLPPAMSLDTAELAQRLDSAGHVVLRDLEFAIGSFDLGDGSVTSLDQIADYLKANPDRRIVFVGHTDATGSLEANISLSRRRATAAVTYLISRHDIARSRISADGVGFLSPISTNLTEEGRAANRRIEAVLISTE